MSDDLLAGLNEAQRAAVTAGDGPMLIVAGPGSGKTRTLTHRIAYLVRERNVPPWRICAVTFTNKAAREMKERLEGLIGSAVNELAVGTFHALCARFLRQYGDEIGLHRNFTIFDDDDQIGLVKQALKALDLDPKQVTPRSMLAGISTAKSAGLSPSQFARGVENYRDELVARVYRHYQELLDHNGGLDFDDLLVRTVELLDRPNGRAARLLPERFLHLLVDEYQDTNQVQFEIVRRLGAGHGNICSVGDVDQAIYAWRGATIRNILDFETTYPNARIIKLEQNYRSTKRILQAADAVIAANQERREKALWTLNGEGESVIVREAFDEQDEARFVVQESQRLMAREGYRASDIAVLYRTNAQSQPLEQACVRYGLPYQIIGGTRFYERREIKDVLALLRLIVNPQDDVSLRRVVDAMPVAEGLGSKTWLRLESWAREAGLSVAAALAAWQSPGSGPAPPLTGRAAAATRALAELLSRLRDRHGQADLVTLFDEALTGSGYAELLQAGSEPERWENLLQLRAELSRYSPLPIDAQLTVFLEEAALVAAVDELDQDREKVTLITLHAAKGLEYPVVFIVGLEDGLLPHIRSLDSQSGLEEERRLAFVGITRARQRLYLTHAIQRGGLFQHGGFGGPASQTRSQFLLPLDALIEPQAGVRRPPRRPGPTPTAGRPGPGGGRGASSWSAPARPASPARPAGSAWPDGDDGDQAEEIVVSVRPGDRVRHERFGAGRVLSVTPSRGDVEVVVEFQEYGAKKLMASLARLSRD